jgi:uncharacterized protein YyaL (SSP411 family)
MQTEEGGFATSLAARSENTEGRFYTWTRQELDSVLGQERGARAAGWWSVGEEGNFEQGRSVLRRENDGEDFAAGFGLEPAALAAEMRIARAQLFMARDRRPRPRRDDKQLAGANALMCSALAHSYQILGSEHHLAAARLALRLVLERMHSPDEGLAATRCGGRNRGHALLADWAFAIQACIDLYESDFDTRWITTALRLEEDVNARFLDRARGGWFDTSREHEPLLAHLKSPQDGALPSGYGVQVLNLLRLSELTGRKELGRRAQAAILGLGGRINLWPAGFSQVLTAVDFLTAGPIEIALAGSESSPELQAMLRALRGSFRPQRVVAFRRSPEDADPIRLLEGRSAPDSDARAWVCHHWSCRVPARTAGELVAALS